VVLLSVEETSRRRREAFLTIKEALAVAGRASSPLRPGILASEEALFCVRKTTRGTQVSFFRVRQGSRAPRIALLAGEDAISASRKGFLNAEGSPGDDSPAFRLSNLTVMGPEGGNGPSSQDR